MDDIPELKVLQEIFDSVNELTKSQYTLAMGYITGTKLLMANKKVPPVKVESCSSPTVDIEPDNNVTRASTRIGRQAAKIATLKINKNLNYPLKLRQPSIGDVFEGTSRDFKRSCSNAPIADITNLKQPKKRKTQKVNQTHIISTDEENDVNAKTDEAAMGNESESFGASKEQPPLLGKTNTQSVVKTQKKKFEELAAQNSATPKKPLTPKINSNTKIAVNSSVERNTRSHVVSSSSNIQISSSNNKQTNKSNEMNSELSDPGSSNMEATRVTRSTRRKVSNSHSSTVSQGSTTLPKKLSVKKGIRKSHINKVNSKSKRILKLPKPILKTHATELIKKEENNKCSREDRLNKIMQARDLQMQKQIEFELAAKKKEEKIKAIAVERERQKKEEEAKKNAIALEKKKKIVEKIKQEEAIRLARLKEKEEEYRRNEAAFLKRKQEMAIQKKLVQDNSDNKQKAQPNEKPMNLAKVAALNQMQAANVTHTIEKSVDNYEITPERRKQIDPKNENDYGIDDAGSEDSTDDEDKPKKRIPSWAKLNHRTETIIIGSYVSATVWNKLYECNINPDVKQLIGKNACKRQRTSSAVWTTPDIKY